METVRSTGYRPLQEWNDNEWSGTKAELNKKRRKLEKSIRFLVNKHRASDESHKATDQEEKEKRTCGRK
jgi:hypothetical protein